MSSIRCAAVSKSTEFYKIRMYVPERIQVYLKIALCILYFQKISKPSVSQWYVVVMYILSKPFGRLLSP